MTIRVLIADDQSMVRAGFRMLLAGEQDMEVVAEASNGLEAVAKAARFDPTVILMDIRMPELDGLQATRRILATDNTARILILTTFGLDEYIYKALSAGASGFVLKDDAPEQLIKAVRTVAAGDALLSPAITKRVINQFTRIPRHEPPKELDELTAREQDLLRLIARGLSNAEIGGSSTSARRPSRPTSRTSSRNSASATASKSSCSHTRPGSYGEPRPPKLGRGWHHPVLRNHPRHMPGVRVNILHGTRVEVDRGRTSRGDVDDGPGARAERYLLAGIRAHYPF